jgi:hypothetical protein
MANKGGKAMKIKIWCEMREDVTDSAPVKTSREYAGWGQGIFFYVCRPQGETGECGEPAPDWDLKDTMLFVGSYGTEESIALKPGGRRTVPLEQVKILSITRGQGEKFEVLSGRDKLVTAEDWRTLTIESEKGNFYLPDEWSRPKEQATLNGEPLVCFQ